MSWLEKIGLVEKSEENVSTEAVTADEFANQLTTEVEADIDDTENIIEEIFTQNGLDDKSNSIYMIESLIATLPEEMTTEKKVATVRGNLAVFGKNIEDLKSDGERRIEVINSARNQVISEKTSAIAQSNEEIESLKKAIEQANIFIKDAESIIAETSKASDDEIKKINTLIDFCTQMENDKE